MIRRRINRWFDRRVDALAIGIIDNPDNPEDPDEYAIHTCPACNLNIPIPYRTAQRTVTYVTTDTSDVELHAFTCDGPA